MRQCGGSDCETQEESCNNNDCEPDLRGKDMGH